MIEIKFLQVIRQSGDSSPVIVAITDESQTACFFIRVGPSILFQQTEDFLVKDMEYSFDYVVAVQASLDLSIEEHLLLSEALNSPEGQKHMGLE